MRVLVRDGITSPSENVAEMAGAAFHRATGALSDVKKKKVLHCFVWVTQHQFY